MKILRPEGGNERIYLEDRGLDRLKIDGHPGLEAVFRI